MHSPDSSTDQMPSSTSSNAPEFTVIYRIGSIPLISSSLEKMNGTLCSNAYTSSPYHTALGLSNSAYNSASKFAGPFQAHLAPLIIRADGIANMAVDAVQKRCPSAFTATPEDIMGYVHERQKNVGEFVKERRQSAGVVVQDIDKKFSPVVDYLQVAVDRIDTKGKENTPCTNDATVMQYQRALELSTRLRDQLQTYSNEQMKQLEAHSALVHHATETARSLSNTASSSIVHAQARMTAVSDNMIAELGNLQVQASALSDSLRKSASEALKDPTAQLPPQIQQKYVDLVSLIQAQTSTASATCSDFSSRISTTVYQLREIMATENVSIQEKATMMAQEVSATVQPLLHALGKNVQAMTGGSNESRPTQTRDGNEHAN
ncbi:hypothetical protein BDP27DRAFT_1420081 [Rhodocollybia butyracea]|uniref:Lipid droplet-associated perilipin protein n=1 Tax=Rhodocollybia butyracea TaxID=206335 RepID=A0A9P5PVY4_9AGAR|nr:hypothetical protein BDP27DRAFT_1420081 [Rhodocollybia butyracea]